MKEWFEKFHENLFGEDTGADLIGAGKASAAEAFDHYRYQHRVKTREAVEETFPSLLQHLGDEWIEVWRSFKKTLPHSPRSLNWYPAVFLEFYLKSDAPLPLKELARFEQAMDVHPWTHRKLTPVDLSGMTEESSLILSHLDLHTFAAPVTKMYNDESPSDLSEKEQVIIWLKADGVNFRHLQEWEVRVLKQVSLSVGEALEHAPDDEEAVGSFFKWLGESNLIRQVINP